MKYGPMWSQTRSCTTHYSTVSYLLYVVPSCSYGAITVRLHEISIHLQKGSDQISLIAINLAEGNKGGT
jgi:hypothetical protein